MTNRKTSHHDPWKLPWVTRGDCRPRRETPKPATTDHEASHGWTVATASMVPLGKFQQFPAFYKVWNKSPLFQGITTELTTRFVNNRTIL